ncbi:MAG: EcsC family protein [Armatimonadota bacterium]
MRPGQGQQSPGTDRVAERIIRTSLDLMGDATLGTVSRRVVLRRYRHAGHEIHDIADIREFDIAVPDRLARVIPGRWQIIAGAAGMATGLSGLPGLITDIPTLLGLNLTAIGECACTYGFDVADEEEHAYAIALLLQGDEPGDEGDILSQLHRTALRMTKGSSWMRLNGYAAASWLRQAAMRLARRLIRRKLGQFVPVIGTVVGGGVNAAFTRRTCEMARRVYRRRFIHEFGQ